MEQGAKFTGRVISVKPKRSPLNQGGLEIPKVISVQWRNVRSLAILKERREEVSYSVEKDYVNDLKSILAEIKGEDIDITSDSNNDEDEREIL